MTPMSWLGSKTSKKKALCKLFSVKYGTFFDFLITCHNELSFKFDKLCLLSKENEWLD